MPYLHGRRSNWPDNRSCHIDLVTITKADNFTLWAHDMRRLNHILDQAFDIDLRHHTNGFNTKNGIQVYTDPREYYFGQNNNGARETRTAFDAFRIKPTSHSIRQDILKFEELRFHWEYAVDLKLNDKMNNGYLDEKFDADPRPGVVASLTASSLSKLPYQQRLDVLHNLHNCDTLPSKDVHIKAFTSSKPIKSKALCHNFARGNCKFGDTCKYAHGDLISPKKNPSKTPFLATAIVPSHAPQPSQEPTKAVVHTYISPRHRQIVGPSLPRGDPNNPLGLSRNQRVKLSALTQDEAMDSWVDQSHYTHVARDSNGNPYLGVFTVDSTSSSTPSASITSPQPHPQTPLVECYGDTFRTF